MFFPEGAWRALVMFACVGAVMAAAAVIGIPISMIWAWLGLSFWKVYAVIVGVGGVAGALLGLFAARKAS